MTKPQQSFALIDIEVFGHRLALPDLPRYQKFYAKLRAGRWESRTFQTLAANLDRSTTYIDIGAWIGVTPFWASHIARSVIAIEPDPRCAEILKQLAPRYPNVNIVEGALSPRPTVKINAVSGFGSSETSALAIGDGEAIEVPGYPMAALLALAGTGPVFVKIDIEGYEYAIVDEIANLRRYEVHGLQCAVHPQLFEKSRKGPIALRRLQTLLCTYRLWRALRPVGRSASVPRYRTLATYLLTGILFRKIPKGTDFLIQGGHPHRPGARLDGCL
jgi:FkbM family methyltransferase